MLSPTANIYTLAQPDRARSETNNRRNWKLKLKSRITNKGGGLGGKGTGGRGQQGERERKRVK